MKVGIVTCGGSNVTSVVNALSHIGVEPILITRPGADYDFLIMPGVGAYDSGIQRIRSSGLSEVIQEHIARKKPFVGICLGMQMLSMGSDEGTETGFGVLEGQFVLLGKDAGSDERLPPNIGYNYVDFATINDGGFMGCDFNGYYYFLHSYAYTRKPEPADIVGEARFNTEVFYPFFVRDNICGIQFHPERSGRRGLALLSHVIKSMAG